METRINKGDRIFRILAVMASFLEPVKRRMGTMMMLESTTKNSINAMKFTIELMSLILMR